MLKVPTLEGRFSRRIMEERLQAFLHYINSHVLHHGGTLDAITHKNFFSALGHDFLAVLHFDVAMIVLVGVLLSALAICNRKKIRQIPHGMGMALELYVRFIRDELVYPNFGGAEHGRKFVPFFCTIFLFIMLANLLGLVPLFTCATGNINTTAALALIFFFMALWSTFRGGGLIGFKHAFLPSGLPIAMRPFMFLMEVVSFGTRTFALAIRLFANMLGGHIVLYAMVSLTAIFGAIATPSLLVAVALYIFEVFVACLQAYVFTMLASIFTGMMVHPQH